MVYWNRSNGTKPIELVVAMTGAAMAGFLLAKALGVKAKTIKTSATQPASHGLADDQLLEVAQRFIIENLENVHLTPDLVIKELGTSRSRAYRLFKSAGGVDKYIRNARLDAVLAALTDQQVKTQIRQLAKRWHFSDASHLTRTFRARFGASPAMVRKGNHIANSTMDVL